MGKVVWTLLDEEKNEILNLYERKIALENLSKIVNPENEKLYNKFITDYGKALSEFQSWWNRTSKKYQWEGSSWRIDFDTNEVIMESN